MLRRSTLRLLTLLCVTFLAGCTPSAAYVATPPPAAATETPPATATPTRTPSATPSPAPTATPTLSPTPLPPVRVLRSYPIDGDQALVPDWPIVITFDRPMNPEAVAAALTLTPAVEGVVEWPEPNRMVIHPAEPWAEGDHTVELAAGPLGHLGERLEEPLTLRARVGGRGVPVPILMYHAIEDLDEGASASKRTWTVSPAAFAQQMAYLLNEGWTTVSPNALAAYLTAGAPLPPKPLIISMDDGYKEVYTVVYPLLKDGPLRPVLYVPADHVGLRAYLDWDQLHELVDAGFWLGSHGYDHTPLREASDADLPHQVGASKAFFEEALGITIDAFCYPYGSYDQRTLSALTAHGYTSAMTLNPLGYQTPGEPLLLNRLLVDYDMTLEEFTELLP
ncbi:MAG TPA: polysaccharide deacetylase family protein [Chloroflexi bacterium]|jgi:peptidoglycan/xylan/chitin deacetylase (PgdA/CDA1 family)|nr:polysaccharide deacetylase family protein [Chloroflexota bacterium]